METIIDGAILTDFFKNQPQQIPFGTEADNFSWISFWSFLKSKTNLDVRNYDENNVFHEAFFKHLTTGRGDSKIIIGNESPIHKEGVVLAKKPSTLYCINGDDESNKEIIENKNGFIISFLNNYKKQWERLSLVNHDKTLSVREDAYIKSCTLKSWEELDNYLTKFTDVVIVDNYIFSHNDLIPSNFEKILVQLNKATPIKFNLTIYTFEGDKSKLNGSILMRKLDSIIEEHGINCNIQLIIADRKVKEHDRGIFTNYLRIKSGDSFNYFDSHGRVKTNGTDIAFASMTEPNERAAAMNVLYEVNENIKYLKERKVLIPFIYGKCDNMLLKQFD